MIPAFLPRSLIERLTAAQQVLPSADGSDWTENTLYATIAGIAVGFIGSEIRDWFRSRRSRKERVESFRLLLDVELKTNVDTAKVLRRDVKLPMIELQNPDLERRVYLWSRRLVALPAPVWQDRVWTAHTGVLAEAFKRETIERLVDIYASLDRTSKIRETLHHTSVLDEARRNSAPVMPPMPGFEGTPPRRDTVYTSFQYQAAELWPEVEVELDKAIWLASVPLEPLIPDWPERLRRRLDGVLKRRKN